MASKGDDRGTRRGGLAMTTGISAGCAGIDTAVAYGIATIARVALPAKLTIVGVTFGVSFALSFMALCLCRAAGDADDALELRMMQDRMGDGPLD